MKKLLSIVIVLFLSISLSAQVPPSPNDGGGAPDAGNTPVGGGAPIGGGLFVLLALGAAYGGKKVYEFSTRKLEE